MSKKQLSLFPLKPNNPEDIARRTPIGATFGHFSDYLRKEGKSEHTIKAFIGDMNLLTEYSGEDTPVGNYNTTRLNEFLHWMEYDRGVSCSRKTYARRVTTLKVYFKWLYQLKAIPQNPARAVLQRSGQAPLSEVLDRAQIYDAIDAAQRMKKGDDTDYRPELLFQLLLQTGIKKSEAGRLTLEDLDRSNPQRPVVIIRHKARNIYKERRIELQDTFLPLFDLYKEQYALKDKIFTCTTRNLEYILTDVGKLAGIEFKLSFEIMRWTMAVYDWRNEMSEDTLREKMGLSRTSWYETGSKIRKLVDRQLEAEKK